MVHFRQDYRYLRTILFKVSFLSSSLYHQPLSIAPKHQPEMKVLSSYCQRLRHWWFLEASNEWWHLPQGLSEHRELDV